jgi:hypothetical protein
MPNLTVKNLEPERMAEAYPLIRCTTRVDPERWEEFGRELKDRGGGVLAAFAEDGCVHGIAAYLPVISLKHGNALRVEAIAAFELGHVSLVRNALSAALDKLARERKCGVVTISLDAKGLFSPRSRRRRGWESLGLTAETIEFVRQLGDEKPRPSGPR